MIYDVSFLRRARLTGWGLHDWGLPTFAWPTCTGMRWWRADGGESRKARLNREGMERAMKDWRGWAWARPLWQRVARCRAPLCRPWRMLSLGFLKRVRFQRKRQMARRMRAAA